jgi:glycerol-3-phosphate dehydrogenase
MDRDDHLGLAVDRRDPWDLVIIGGGASGMGTALDAASRGLSVLLLEAVDFGKGTSSRSTKLIHGGVRYLRQGNISLVRESLRERTRLLSNAPHLVHPLEFVLPCRSWFETTYYRTGMKLYDWLAGPSEFLPSKRLSKSAVLAKLPALHPNCLSAGISYFDGQFDDARLIISLLRTAASAGAVLVNGARVTKLNHASDGRVVGLQFRDEETQQLHQVSARCMVNATGPFCDSVRKLDNPQANTMVSASQGIHLVLPKSIFPGETAIIVPETSDGRVVFIIPWHDHVLLGTTDTAIETALEEPVAMESEIEFLLTTAKDYFQRPPTRSDCLSAFTGIRPLVTRRPGASTSTLSRDHTIEVAASGLITMTGGKWTTYRQMAQDCVDRVLHVSGQSSRPCVTQEMRLHGWVMEGTELGSKLSTLRVYGSDLALLEKQIQLQPKLGELIHPNLPYRVVDVHWAVQHEWARSVEDVLARRTRGLFLNARAAIECSSAVAAHVAQILGLDIAWQVQQVESFKKVASLYVP